MILYHCTTPKKLDRYKKTGCILSPVRGWKYINSAKNWCKKTGRSIILKIETGTAYPLPDHQPRGHAFWIDDNIRNYKAIKV